MQTDIIIFYTFTSCSTRHKLDYFSGFVQVVLYVYPFSIPKQVGKHVYVLGKNVYFSFFQFVRDTNLKNSSLVYAFLNPFSCFCFFPFPDESWPGVQFVFLYFY